MLMDVYFRSLKINHDSHEFIRDSGTVANTKCSGPGSQCCDVVLVKGCINSVKPQGVGISGWGADGEGWKCGEISLQATWDQGGRILSQQRGFQVSEGDQEREAKGNQQRRKRIRGKHHMYEYKA
jgi:hypothetical protein